MRTIGYLILTAAVVAGTSARPTFAAVAGGVSTTGTAVTTASQLTPVYGGAGAYMSGYGYGATVEGQYLRGWADVIRSVGERTLATSRAAINWSIARQHEIENYHLWATTYLETRDFNRQYRVAAARRERGNPANLVRYAQIEAPKPLSNLQLDKVTGQIRWPTLLTSVDFASKRAVLEKIFAARAYRGVLGAEDYVLAVRTVDEMKDELRSFVTSVPPQAYAEAKGFLRSLSYEARLPTG
jgi:hypothetical protein